MITFLAWQRHLMIIFLIAQMNTFLAFSSFFCSLNEVTRQLSAISFAILVTVVCKLLQY